MSIDDQTEKPAVRSLEGVQSFERGLAVIRAFDRENSRLTLAAVARRSNLPRAAARRFLQSLKQLNYVGTDGNVFFLRPRILELGYSFLSSFSPAEVSLPHIERLAADVQEFTATAVLDLPDIVYVARATTNRLMSISLLVGSRLPAYCTSMGRILLAAMSDADLDRFLATADLRRHTETTITDRDELHKELLDVRRRGWALINAELERGMRSIAVPLHGSSGSVLGAVNISAHAGRVQADELQRDFLPKLQACAAQIERDLRALF